MVTGKINKGQEANWVAGGTPGGLEHIGDVWRLLAKWEQVVHPALEENE
jgi:hypothetical protein